MTALGEYILGVLCSALICGMIGRIHGKKGIQSNLVQILCSIFMIISIVTPLARLSFDTWENFHLNVQQDAHAAADKGKMEVNSRYREVITERATAYILDKAESLGLSLEVTVTLSKDELAAPRAVTLQGKVSPYAKQVLSSWLANELGIEEQEWISA